MVGKAGIYAATSAHFTQFIHTAAHIDILRGM